MRRRKVRPGLEIGEDARAEPARRGHPLGPTPRAARHPPIRIRGVRAPRILTAARRLTAGIGRLAAGKRSRGGSSIAGDGLLLRRRVETDIAGPFGSVVAIW